MKNWIVAILFYKNFIINNKDDEEILKNKTQKLEYRAFQKQLSKYLGIPSL